MNADDQIQQQTIFEFGKIQSSEDWVLYGAVLAALAGLVWYIYRKDTSDRSRWVRWPLIGLRWSTYLLVFWVFLDPRMRVETTRTRPSRTAIVVDTSLSMSIADEKLAVGSARTRMAALTAALSEKPFIGELRKTQEVAIYRFGKELAPLVELDRRELAGTKQPPVDDDNGKWLAMLAADQTQTRLGDSLGELLQRESSTPLAGVVLFSDGRNNAGATIDAAIKLAKTAKAPIFAVGLGSEQAPINLRVTDLQLPARAFRGDEFVVRTFIHATGISKRTVPVELLLSPADAPAGKGDFAIVESRDVELSSSGEPTPVEFAYLPKEVGSWRLSVRAPNEPGDLRPADNSASGSVEVFDRKTKVLIVAGGPSREYHFLRTLLHRDKSMELSVYLQSARDEISQDASHVLRKFPDSKETFFAYDVVIAIDPDWTALAPAERTLLIEWVGSQAGGLILVAGPIHTPRLSRDETFDDIKRLYPVSLKEMFTSELDINVARDPWPLALTSEGKSAELLRLDDNPELSLQRWSEFAGFFSTYPVSGVKAGASVMAEFSDPRAAAASGAPPAVAYQFYGAGRVLYLGSGEVWRLRRLGEKYYDRFWVQAIRQIAQGRLLRGASRGTIVLEADRYPLGTSIPVRVQLFDADYQPSLAKSASISAVDPSGKVQEMALAAEQDKAGRYFGLLPVVAAGEYRLQLFVPQTTDVVEKRFRSVLPDLEFDDPRLDRPLLERLANSTGGKLVPLDQLMAIPPLLEDRSELTVYSAAPIPLWDRAWVMILFASLISFEWAVRKYLLLA